ncbi:hypothetical protein AB0425_15130 [Actinosynnema sp. NPDC051121]
MDTRSATAVSRLARRLFAWRNPVACPGDRLESAVAVVSVTVALLGLPVAAAVGSEVYVQEAALSSEQLRTRHQADAVLLVDTPSSAGGTAHNTSVSRFSAPATWPLPDGTVHRGVVRAAGDLPAGAEVRVWIDDSGAPVDAPLTAEGAVVTAAAVATGSWFALTAAMAILYGVVRHVHVRFRRHRWAAEWEAVEPGWRKLG